MAKLDRMENNLQILFVKKETSLADFKMYHSRIEAERHRLKNTIDAIRQRQNLMMADFEITLEMAA